MKRLSVLILFTICLLLPLGGVVSADDDSRPSSEGWECTELDGVVPVNAMMKINTEQKVDKVWIDNNLFELDLPEGSDKEAKYVVTGIQTNEIRAKVLEGGAPISVICLHITIPTPTATATEIPVATATTLPTAIATEIPVATATTFSTAIATETTSNTLSATKPITKVIGISLAIAAIILIIAVIAFINRKKH